MHGLNLYDYSARYYEPAIGRFTTVDPLAEMYYSISPYAYCNNNPLRFIDPTGEAWEPYDKDGNAISPDDRENIKGYRWINDEMDENGNIIRKENTVQIAWIFGEKGITLLGGVLNKPMTRFISYDDVTTGDKISDDKIASLHSDVRKQMLQFVMKAKLRFDIQLKVTDGYRTVEQQNAIYAKGRTSSGSIVTNAKGGYSNHNFGLAIDVVPIENGKLNWDSANWNLIGRIGESVGLEWGGRWKFVDKPHFQNLQGKSLKELRSLSKDANGLPIIK